MSYYKIKEVQIKKLFGIADNNLEVQYNPNKNINVMYSLNGTGKTTLFKLLDAALNIKFSVLDSIQFKKIKIIFDNEEELVIEKNLLKPFDSYQPDEYPKDNIGKAYFPITYTWKDNDGSILDAKLYLESDTKTNMRDLLNYAPKGNTDWVEIENKLLKMNISLLYSNKDYNRSAKSLNSRSQLDNGFHKKNHFDKYESNDFETYSLEFVEQQVKRRRNEISMMSDMPYEEWSENLISRTRKYDSETKYINLPLDDKMTYIKNKLNDYKTEEYKYFDMMAQYGKNYESLESKINCLENIINNEPGLVNKDFFIDRKSLVPKIILKNKSEIPIEYLSSGEKNVILLYFYLIFNAESNSIILIDEPEVSLHVDWIESLIDNIYEICKQRNLQVIFATHSPDFVCKNHFDLSVILHQESGDENE